MIDLMNRKIIFCGVLAISMGLSFFSASMVAAYYRPILTIQAETLEIKKPLSELAKLNHLFDKYKATDVRVVTDGITRSTWSFALWARGFLKRSYNMGDDAAFWVRRYTYRSDKGNIIYFRYADGSLRLMRDVFLEELANLELASSSELTALEAERRQDDVEGSDRI